MPKLRAEDFRKQVIQKLVDETRWPRQFAKSGIPPRLAERLGVTEFVLREAVELIRAGYRTKESWHTLSPLVELRMVMPIEISMLVQNLAETVGRTRAGFIRDVIQAAMLTAQEPTRQPRSHVKKMIFRGRLLSGKWRYDQPRISKALRTAVTRRAMAFGEPPNLYIRAWLIDLVEGRLPDMDIPPVLSTQMYDSPDAYVLPAKGK